MSDTPNKSEDRSPDLVRFEGPVTVSERTQLQRVLRQAETMLDLPHVPASAGARWTVDPDRDGLVTISRLGVKYVFAAGTMEAAARKVEAWTLGQSGDHSLE